MILSVVMYHYVRDPSRTRFPRIHSLSPDAFCRQVQSLQAVYEMATLESALAFLRGDYRPSRSLCLLTFDDALKEHHRLVMPILHDAGIEGVFFVQTSAPNGIVTAVHKSQFLMAALGVDEYRSRFLEQLGDIEPDCPVAVDDRQVRRVYRWDDIEVARFKFLVNFVVRDAVRERIIDDIFVERLGDEQAFARELYLDWADAREMQDAGMLIGGHSHGHAALSRMETEERRADLSRCVTLLREGLKPQPLWPFSYPFGDVDEATRALVHELGFTCAFTTQVGANAIGSDPFLLRRIDPKDVPVQEPCISSH